MWSHSHLHHSDIPEKKHINSISDPFPELLFPFFFWLTHVNRLTPPSSAASTFPRVPPRRHATVVCRHIVEKTQLTGGQPVATKIAI